MKQEETYRQVRTWVLRNARHLEAVLWKCLFEHGEKMEVVEALQAFQNEDGGFGHGLEADNWNPDSSPIQLHQALVVLDMIQFYDMAHPIYQGIWKYLTSEKDLLEYGWRFTIASNDKYPHAPWWNYNEEENKKEYFGITAYFVAFIIKYGDRKSALHQKAVKLLENLLDCILTKDIPFGDMGIKCFMYLVQVMEECGIEKCDMRQFKRVLSEKVTASIEYNTEKWSIYCTRPSKYIRSPLSIFYEDNKEIVEKELRYLLELLESVPEGDTWPITWSWFDNMEQYENSFRISEIWWKGFVAIENIQFLRNFNVI